MQRYIYSGPGKRQSHSAAKDCSSAAGPGYNYRHPRRKITPSLRYLEGIAACELFLHYCKPILVHLPTSPMLRAGTLEFTCGSHSHYYTSPLLDIPSRTVSSIGDTVGSKMIPYTAPRQPYRYAMEMVPTTAGAELELELERALSEWDAFKQKQRSASSTSEPDSWDKPAFEWLDRLDSDMDERTSIKKYLALLRHLSKSFQALPLSLTVDDITLKDSWPVAGGGFAASLATGGRAEHKRAEQDSQVSPWMQNRDIISYLKDNPDHDLSVVGNILVDDNLHCCLADFGLTLVTPTSHITASFSSSVNGAIRWLAPEYIDFTGESAPQNHTSRDVYAFGCTILEPPFQGHPNDGSVIFKLMSGGRPARPVDVWCPDEIWNLTTSCWAQIAQDRPSATEIFDILAERINSRHPSPGTEEVISEVEHTETEMDNFVPSGGETDVEAPSQTPDTPSSAAAAPPRPTSSAAAAAAQLQEHPDRIPHDRPSTPLPPFILMQSSRTYQGFLPHTPHRIIYQNKTYPTASHLHEALKYLPAHPEIASIIRSCASLRDVRQVKAVNRRWVRSDWGKVFLKEMENVLELKFLQHPELRMLLTVLDGSGVEGDGGGKGREIIYRDERDTFWGDGGSGGDGENAFGEILRTVRDRLIAKDGERGTASLDSVPREKAATTLSQSNARVIAETVPLQSALSVQQQPIFPSYPSPRRSWTPLPPLSLLNLLWHTKDSSPTPHTVLCTKTKYTLLQPISTRPSNTFLHIQR
ncbi:hypothetical protein D9757_006627 [Collybiopsis confluens]|uniref:Protein kinase domain-containing protein n=1 Tax=Collybiopsis confluens TaxID=2823264 RepID=A0A8H5HMU3_9AGAR|nr:hypothetical protein D9757_006627 [Collybiopsis confluens]